jgi:REP element-mobilizing transposase RayT
VVRGVRYLRGFRIYPIVRRALCDARVRLGMRIIHFSIQGDHLHLIDEAMDRVALGRAMKGLEVRIAKRLNRAAGRKGRVFADRYHSRYLRTPRETRTALVYVLQNGKKHAPRGEERIRASREWIDPHSSAAYFDGWTERSRRFVPPRDACDHPLHRWDFDVPVAPPGVWLLTTGWRRAGGLIDSAERPAGARA